MALTAYMQLNLPTVSVTLGPLWAEEVNDAFARVDLHDHSSGLGVKISPAGLNINADLSIQNNNLNAVRALRTQSQSTPINGASDKGCVYNVGGDLWWNSGAGDTVQITTGGTLNSGSLVSNVWTVRSVNTNIVINAGDTYVYYAVDCTFARTITLPTPAAAGSGRFYHFKTVTGSQTLTITWPGGVTYKLDDHGVTTFVSDGATWNIMESAPGRFSESDAEVMIRLGDPNTIGKGRILTAINNPYLVGAYGSQCDVEFRTIDLTGSNTDLSGILPATHLPDASQTAKGVVQLANAYSGQGDLFGTSTNVKAFALTGLYGAASGASPFEVASLVRCKVLAFEPSVSLPLFTVDKSASTATTFRLRGQDATTGNGGDIQITGGIAGAGGVDGKVNLGKLGSTISVETGGAIVAGSNGNIPTTTAVLGYLRITTPQGDGLIPIFKAS